MNDATDRDDFVDKNVPNLNDYIVNSGDPINFYNVKAQFNEYVRSYHNFTVPLQLDCVR